MRATYTYITESACHTTATMLHNTDGLCFVQSSSEPANAWRLTVLNMGSLIVAFLPLPQRSFLLGFDPPLLPPSHSAQPIVHPTENHRQVCADSHACVPFLQAHG